MDTATLDGTLVRRLRLEAGLTQTEAAAALGVQRNTVARWERGELGFHRSWTAEQIVRRLRAPVPTTTTTAPDQEERP